MKEDVVQKIDRILVNEFFPSFFAGVSAMKGKGGFEGPKAKDILLKELVREVLWHEERDHMKAIDIIAKNKNLDKKIVKMLKNSLKNMADKMNILDKIDTYIIEAKVGQKILSQIKVLDKWALDSWGSKNFVGSDNGIQFDVRGPKFSGRVLIELDKLSDTYVIEFGNVRKLEWIVKKRLQNIFAEDLVNVLDQHIG